MRETPINRPTVTSAIILTALLLGCSKSGQAAVLSFNDLASFSLMAGSLTTVNFNGTAPPGDYTDHGTSVTYIGATFSVASGSTLFSVSPSFTPETYDYGTGDVLAGFDPELADAPLTITLPSGVSAVALEFGSATPNLNFAFAVNSPGGNGAFQATGGRPLATGAGAGLRFIGFVSTAPITSVTITPASGGVSAYDNVRLGASAPEPSTASLLLAGVALASLLAVRGDYARSSSTVQTGWSARTRKTPSAPTVPVPRGFMCQSRRV